MMGVLRLAGSLDTLAWCRMNDITPANTEVSVRINKVSLLSTRCLYSAQVPPMRLLSALEPSLVWLPWKKAEPSARAEQVWARPRTCTVCHTHSRQHGAYYDEEVTSAWVSFQCGFLAMAVTMW